MRIPTWRLALTGGAIVILVLAGLGLAAASNGPATPAANVAAAAPSAGPATTGPAANLKNRVRGLRALRFGRHLVHATVTVTDRDGNLVNLQFDHGTVQSIGNGTLTISEAGGGTQTVSTDDATKVFLGRNAGKLADVKVGAEIFVRSRIDGGTTLAKRILVVPAAAS
ncbi:MAG TPA: DUF5666 domain-containing protein [Candidatus Dormibacteraeota bacterium]|nr:DUF5666 domain-containing protein [Candidatus Dormibacteraeota bacterium]